MVKFLLIRRLSISNCCSRERSSERLEQSVKPVMRRYNPALFAPVRVAADSHVSNELVILLQVSAHVARAEFLRASMMFRFPAPAKAGDVCPAAAVWAQ